MNALGPGDALLDLLAHGWDLWDVLDEHARLETDAVGQCLDRFWRGDAAPAS
jgi:hypothetical protein